MIYLLISHVQFISVQNSAHKSLNILIINYTKYGHNLKYIQWINAKSRNLFFVFRVWFDDSQKYCLFVMIHFKTKPQKSFKIKTQLKARLINFTKC